jgi:exodeoxyribonuclease-5
MTSATFTPTAGQAYALARFREFLTAPGPEVFTLCGFAGTGKSTLVWHLVQEVRGGQAAVRVVAPTAKAASVLRRKGFPSAMTVHKMLYRKTKCAEPTRHKFKCECGGKERWVFVRPDLRGVRLIVVDEASMVGERMAQDLSSLNTKILAIGDTFQLPPWGGGNSLLTINRPDAELTEVCRQELDSPVLRIATEIRENRRLMRGWTGDSLIAMDSTEMPYFDYGRVPIIVRRNNTRHSINANTRRMLGRPDWKPQPGDCLVGRHNDYNAGVINGELYRVVIVAPGVEDGRISLIIRDEDDNTGTTDRLVQAWAGLFRGAPEHKEFESWHPGTKKEAQQLHYGYCITAHSSQGSEWDNVVVLDESGSFGDKWRWLYTAVTRAANRVFILADYRHH